MRQGGIVWLCLVLTTGCGFEAPGTGVRWIKEFEYVRTGGECEGPDGPATCELRVIVRDDGTWSATGVPEPPASGTLPMGAASELAVVFEQSIRYFTEEAFHGICPTRDGGEEYGYVSRQIPVGPGSEDVEPRVREIMSCTYDLERHESLVKRNQIEGAWLVYKPPELDDVEFR